jgi:hypothetical protein
MGLSDRQVTTAEELGWNGVGYPKITGFVDVTEQGTRIMPPRPRFPSSSISSLSNFMARSFFSFLTSAEEWGI